MFSYRNTILIGCLLLAGCAGMPAQRPASPNVAVPPPPPPPMAVPAATAPATAALPAPAATPAAAPAAPPLMPPPAPPPPPRHRSPAQPDMAAAPARHSRHVHRPPTPPSAAAATATTVAIEGHVVLSAGRGQHVSAADLADTLVYFVPKSGNVMPRPGAFTVFTHDRAYDPAAMAIPAGSTITFVNMDEVRHNEFSVTPGSAFNLGYQAPGQKTAHVFAHAGLVLVGCLVHRSMELDLLIVPTTFVTRVAPDGRYSLHDLPPGPGTLYAWNPRARLQAEAVVAPRHAVDLGVTIVKPAASSQIDVSTQP